MKHIREIGNQISNQDFHLLMQGISGGKAKMKHYFLKENEKKSILIGLLDTWRDEHEILQYLDTVIIAKIPFDPPTDPYFLAKTNGMSNSFERYSKPIVLAKLNSLIANIRVLNKNAKILCTDARIETTEWGKFIKKNLF